MIYRIDKDQPIYDSDMIAAYAHMDGEPSEWIGILTELEGEIQEVRRQEDNSLVGYMVFVDEAARKEWENG